MAVGLKYINKNFFDDDFSKTLNHKEKLILIHLFFIQGNGGIVKINLGSIEQALNSTSIIEKLDNDEEIDDSEYISKKDCRKTIKLLIDNKKLVKMKDGFYLFVNYFKNQNIQNQSIFLGVINNLQEVMLKNDWMLEFMKQENQYFDQLGFLVYEHLTAKPKKSNKEQESTAYKFRLKIKYLDFCDSFQLLYNQDVSRWGTPVKDLSDTCLTEEQHLSDTQGDTCRGNININSNVNINSNTNANKKHSSRMNNIKNKSQTNIESSKNPSLGGQVFEDSSPEAKLSARVKKKKKKEEEETREERKARKQKERKDACDLALTLMKVYKGVDLRRKLKKVLQPYEPEEYDQVMETPRARYWDIPAKQYYFSERSIPDAQIEQAERVVEKVNEYVMDNFDADEQIPALNPLCSETVYKILNDYFQRSEDAFLEELFSHFNKLKEEGRLHNIRNLDMHIYSFGTNVPIDDLLNKDLL